jgi:hypothetical protein
MPCEGYLDIHGGAPVASGFDSLHLLSGDVVHNLQRVFRVLSGQMETTSYKITKIVYIKAEKTIAI